MEIIHINNKFYKKNEAKVSVFDHSLLYGDGIFETLRVYRGKIFKIDEHIKRIFHSARLINLKIPPTSLELEKAIYSTIKKNKLSEAYVRVTITRGEGDLGYLSKCIPNVIIIAKKFIPHPKSMYKNGVSIVTYNTERILPEIKSTSCLPLVIAKSNTANYFEALLVDNDRNVTEGTVSNIFFAKGNVLYTPKENILFGVTRGTVIKIAGKTGIQVKEAKIKESEIHQFEECFLTNSLAEVVPVVEINNKKINNGIPGAITKKVMDGFKKEISLWLKKIYLMQLSKFVHRDLKQC